MIPSIDYLALALLASIALIAIFLRLRFRNDETVEPSMEDGVFYRQRQLEPRSAMLPITGLGEGRFWAEGNGYLPGDISRFLADGDVEDVQNDDSGLIAALHPAPKINTTQAERHLLWTVTALIILVGLTFLLLWMLTFI